MISNKLSVSTSKLADEIKELKIEKEKLVSLKNKMINSKDNLINSNLSGRTYEESIKDNEVFINLINDKINLFTEFISSLEAATEVYNEEIAYLKNSVRG